MRRDAFQAIADPIRREIIDLLAQDTLTASEVAEHFEISRQAVSKQLKVLDECGVVAVRKQGRERYYSIQPQSLVPAYLWIEQLHKQWEERIDSFEDYLNQLKANQEDDKS